jgi:DNA-binding transcriptional LysR family regulator
VHGRVDTDEYAFVRAMLLADVGVALAPVTMFAALVETGELERVLPRYVLRSAPVHVVWPSRRFEPAAVTLLREAIVEALPLSLASAAPRTR